MTTDPAQTKERIAQTSHWIPQVRHEMHRVLVGQRELVDRMFIALLTSGHILLEGVPGLAKTLTVKALAGCLNVSFKRFQFTPDLLPADLLGTLIYSPSDGQFKPKLGPIFANLILADEINRAPAKVQSALLEAMQERQVTLAETTYKLPDPFLVMATMNPIDQQGTYSLPEAQLDRFLLKVNVGYPTKLEERQILELMGTSSAITSTSQVCVGESVTASREVVNSIYLDERIKSYIIDLIFATREPAAVLPELKHLIRCGASPRGTINLALASRAVAYLAGREYVTPQDVKDIVPDVLRHRLLLTYEAEAEGVAPEDILARLLERVPMP